MSPRRRLILQIVNDSVVTTGVSPSANELADRFGTSTAAVLAHISGLIADGWMVRRAGHNSKRCLEVIRLPGQGLLAAEVAWCHANPERVRALMTFTGARVENLAEDDAEEPPEVASSDEFISSARSRIAALEPGVEIEIDLPRKNPARVKAYRRVSLLAIRQWGRGGVTRVTTSAGVRLRRVSDLG